MRAAVVAEGWADDVEAADALLAVGRGDGVEPANDAPVVVPMATAMGPRTPVWCVELADGRHRAFAPINQGSGRWPGSAARPRRAIERLVFLREVGGTRPRRGRRAAAARST